MTWLQPWAVWFLSAAPVIIALYLVRMKRRRVTVSTLMFWQRIVQRNAGSALFQRLRHLFSLLLQLIILLLLVGALARPAFDRLVRDDASTVVVLDARARMQAVEPDGRTRFAKAVASARGFARQAGGAHQIALVTLDAQPSVTVPFTNDAKQLVEALDSALPADATGSLDDALHLADTLLSARSGNRRIVVLTDRRAANAKRGAIPVLTHAAGTARDNLAITRFATRALPASPETAEVLLEVANFGTNPAHAEPEISLDGRVIDVKSFQLQPGERRVELLTSVPRLARNSRGCLIARLSTRDALPLDNVAYATLPPQRLDRVLLVSAGNAFLEKLLSVDAGVRFQFVSPDAYQPSMAEKFEVVILDGVLPAGFDLRAASGNFLLIRSTPFGTGPALLEQPVVTDVDASHPATRLVSLQNVSILRAERLSVPAPRDGWAFSAPLRSFGHPLLITGQRGTQRIAALAFDVLQSDLPLRVAFPLLMNNTLRWLAGDRSNPLPALSAGEIMPLAPEQTISARPLTSFPTSRDERQAGTISGFFKPLRNGFYELTGDGAPRWLAVNTFSATESDLRVPDGEAAAALPEPIPSTTLHSRPPWQWLALLALILIHGEWWLFHRRRTE